MLIERRNKRPFAPHFSVQFWQDQLDQMKAISKKNKISLNETIRLIVDAYLEEHPEELH